MSSKEARPPDGIIGPSPEEIKHFNTLHGPLLQPSGVMKGIAAVLGLGTAAFAVEACARPAPPAEVRPAIPPQGTTVPTPLPTEVSKTPEVQSSKKPIVEFKLQKVDSTGNTQWEPAMASGSDGKQHHLTSKYFLPNIQVEQNSRTGAPFVVFQLTEEGSNLLMQITENNIGKVLGIFVDGELVSTPTIRSAVAKSAIISGLSETDTYRLADRLNEETRSRSGELDAGMQSFTSLNYPYKVSYPFNWTAESTNTLSLVPAGQKKVDILSGRIEGSPASITILAEPVEKWVTLDDYAKNLLVQFRKIDPKVVNATEEIKKLGNDASKVGISLLELYNTKVDGQNIHLLFVKIPSLTGEEQFSLIAVALKDSQAWVISLNSPLNFDHTSIPLKRILQSIKFLPQSK